VPAKEKNNIIAVNVNKEVNELKKYRCCSLLTYGETKDSLKKLKINVKGLVNIVNKII
jgi:hypothetical protein